jgi:hypothetical protein
MSKSVIVKFNFVLLGQEYIRRILKRQEKQYFKASIAVLKSFFFYPITDNKANDYIKS